MQADGTPVNCHFANWKSISLFAGITKNIFVSVSMVLFKDPAKAAEQPPAAKEAGKGKVKLWTGSILQRRNWQRQRKRISVMSQGNWAIP